MTVNFIGAGPGDPELITVRGQRLIQAADVVLYAGSLVPIEVVACARAEALVMDTAPMTLDEIMAVMEEAHSAGQDVARVHSGDPSLYGAIGEQIRRLDAAGISYDITPGVPAFAAAAATLGSELTLPGVAQTVILTRTATRSSPMPNNEQLEALARTGATLAIHLSIRTLRDVCATLIPEYGEDCPAIIVYRASWPDEQIVRGTLATLPEIARPLRLRRTALILVGAVLDPPSFDDSRLYDSTHFHVLRPKKKSEKTAS
jgi:precorrin-4/cobalt-precorrin-4 C11-methyltransferase